MFPWIKGFNAQRLLMTACACLWAGTMDCKGQLLRMESVGVQFGFAANRSSRDFHQAEASVNWDLPWKWDLGSQWHLRTRLGLSAGWLGEAGTDAGIASIGPMLVLGNERFPIYVEAGISPTVLTRSEFDSKNLGLPFQFTNILGAYWDIARHFRIGYRFQHMSNAGLSSRNPGLNLNVVQASYRF